jgi:hypothetical protein
MCRASRPGPRAREPRSSRNSALPGAEVSVLKSASRHRALQSRRFAPGLLLALPQRKFRRMLVSALERFVRCAALTVPLLLASAAAVAQELAEPTAAVPAAPAAPSMEAPPAAAEAAPPVAAPAAVAAATTGPLSLTWTSANATCDGSAVGPRALELVSRGITPHATEARALVEGSGTRWSVQLETRSQSRMGQRTLRGESCKEIQQAIALLLAMIMEAEAKGESTPPTAPTESLSMLNPDEDPEVDAVPIVPLPAHPGRALLVRTEGSAAVGLQPSLGLGVSGNVGVALGSLELHVGGAYWPTSRAAIFDRDGAIEMSRRAVGASVCYGWLGAGRIELLSCLGPEWLWMKWRSTGLAKPRGGNIRHLVTLNGGLELRLTVLGPLFASLSSGFTWEQRRAFQAKKCEECSFTDVFHTRDIGLRFGAGMGARF